MGRMGLESLIKEKSGCWEVIFFQLIVYQNIWIPLILIVDVVSLFLRQLIPMIRLGCILLEND